MHLIEGDLPPDTIVVEGVLRAVVGADAEDQRGNRRDEAENGGDHEGFAQGDEREVRRLRPEVVEDARLVGEVGFAGDLRRGVSDSSVARRETPQLLSTEMPTVMPISRVTTTRPDAMP